MEQGRGEEDGRKHPDDQQRRLKQPENSLHPHPPPEKCPRCDSPNTKFCYYNNYSLTQPRYFCKGCRRYWTQGGTLRNVPVGGGCRKGKRAKSTSSTGESSRSQPSPPLMPPLQKQVQFPMNLTTINLPSEIGPMGSYYSGGGFLSAMQSFNQPQGYDQPLDVGGQFGFGASNLALLEGVNIPSWRSQQAQTQQLNQQNDFYNQMENGDNNMDPLYPSDQSSVHPSRTMGSWTQSFMITNTNPSGSNPSFWHGSSTSNTTNSSSGTGPSLTPNPWSDLPGFGSPP